MIEGCQLCGESMPANELVSTWVKIDGKWGLYRTCEVCWSEQLLLRCPICDAKVVEPGLCDDCIMRENEYGLFGEYENV